MDELQKLKILLLESKYPFFTDEELTVFLEDNGNDVYKTASELCMLKADGDKSVTVEAIKIEYGVSDFLISVSQKYFERYQKENENISDTSNKYVIKMKRSPYA